MKISNIRLGFATNSSSSHSVIILPHNVNRPGDHSNDDFGWDDFTLSSLTEKSRYLDSQMTYLGGGNPDNYIDHQSVWGNEGLNLSDRLTGLDLRDSEDLQSFMRNLIQNERVIILGGNDNSDGHPLSNVMVDQGGFRLGHTSNFIVVRDPMGHFVLFDNRSGDKFRLSLDDKPAPTKGTWPELVDIKITDFCPYDCSYCYQGSTVRGNHAPLEYLQRIATMFKNSGVLEVALGGGEPTLHPDFEKIVEAFSSAGCIVNVTSRNIKYWENLKASGSNKKTMVTAVAFSVDSAKELLDIKNRIGYISGVQIHFQVVVGTVSADELEKIMEAAGDSRLTLLGYKTTGRGREAMAGLPIIDVIDQTEWIKPWVSLVERARLARDKSRTHQDLENAIYQMSGDTWSTSFRQKIAAWREANPPPPWVPEPNIAIDTTLASHCQKALEDINIPKVTYATSSGAFSAYIDAVEERLGPCSYAPSEMREFDLDSLWERYSEMVPINA